MLEDIIKEFKDYSELKVYTEAQFKTIIELNKKIKLLEEKNKSLESLLQSSVKIIPSNLEQSLVSTLSSDEEYICRTQLNILKNKAEMELTLEETKKVEIFTKILISITSKDKPLDGEYKKLSDTELLSLVKTNEHGS